MPEGAPRPSRLRLRPTLRALHRDLGYLAVGFTFIYALSGLAVNHIATWDPNFVNYEREFTVPTPIPEDDDAAARWVLTHGGFDAPEGPIDVYRASPEALEITLPRSTLFVALPGGRVVEAGQRPRPVLRIANWLHLNRGKRAWTYFADTYAVALLVLAASGLFMIPGKKGLRGRGAVLVGIGVTIPLLYLAIAGTP